MKKNRKVKMTFNVPIEVQRQIKNYATKVRVHFAVKLSKNISQNFSMIA